MGGSEGGGTARGLLLEPTVRWARGGDGKGGRGGGRGDRGGWRRGLRGVYYWNQHSGERTRGGGEGEDGGGGMGKKEKQSRREEGQQGCINWC